MPFPLDQSELGLSLSRSVYSEVIAAKDTLVAMWRRCHASEQE